jgi:hypothetical protein
MKYEYPTLYDRISNYIPMLILLHDIAIQHLSDDISINANSVIFYCAISYIKKCLDVGLDTNLDKKDIGCRINILAFLQLIEKLRTDGIDKVVIDKAKIESMNNNFRNMVSFYNIPSYDSDLLQDAENKSILFNDLGLTMKGMSRELIFNTFGKEEADRVFPQQEEFGMSPLNKKMGCNIENICIDLLNKKGYLLESDIIKKMDNVDSLVSKQKKIKKVLPSIIMNHGLYKKRVNKDLKSEYKLRLSGYPDIYFRNELTNEELFG